MNNDTNKITVIDCDRCNYRTNLVTHIDTHQHFYILNYIIGLIIHKSR